MSVFQHTARLHVCLFNPYALGRGCETSLARCPVSELIKCAGARSPLRVGRGCETSLTRWVAAARPPLRVALSVTDYLSARVRDLPDALGRGCETSLTRCRAIEKIVKQQVENISTRTHL
jgi:hypothetical protein